jgi:Carboxypeptidase regulatory-like domain
LAGSRLTVRLAAAALLGPFAAAAGQSVEGVLIDSQSGRPVPRATLRLIDSADAVHDSTTSDRSGRFRLTGGASGRYVISAARDQYASVLSGSVPLEVGRTVSYTMEVPPLSIAAMTQIRETMTRNERLRSGVVALCRGRMNPLEGGILMGVVRARRSREPLEAARATIANSSAGDTGATPTAITDPHGTYLFCFVPEGDAVEVLVEAVGFLPATQTVEIRRGTISWYDFRLRPASGTQ